MPPRRDFDTSVPTISPDPADLFFNLFSRYILRRDQQVYKAIQLVKWLTDSQKTQSQMTEKRRTFVCLTVGTA